MSAPSREAAHPPSPCIGVCTVDPATRTCGGCRRTLDEIAAWFTASAAQKHAILADIARRSRA
ncbi:DUF1289 domain-containing protein [Novosphingobium huizhouense]|uniref:DUF1289 domain-containing protein n=1 Tax=Novosphingobium huizhouense TaxID=2866625 RepID=UPI001CD81DF0|nr:DUF1289 domain-containing protein [Novosphingobium huizhouense]